MHGLLNVRLLGWAMGSWGRGAVISAFESCVCRTCPCSLLVRCQLWPGGREHAAPAWAAAPCASL